MAERVAKRLCELFVRGDKSEEEKYELLDSSRPLLVLLDRNVDIHTLLHHPWKYIALIHDVLGIQNAKAAVSGAQNKRVEYELDFLHDTFLQTYALKEYQVVGENIEAEFNKWKHEYETMTGKKAEDTKDPSRDRDISAKLNEALDQVPEMTERKIYLDTHTNLASTLYEHIKKRGIDKLVDLELEIMTSKSVSSKVRLHVHAADQDRTDRSPRV